MTQLSFSAVQKYKTCPKMYQLHYQDRLRSDKIGSPLLFGNAIDEALNVLLLKKKKILTEEEKALSSLDPKQIFDRVFTYQLVNGEQEDMPTSLFLEYYKSDFDADLLDDEDILRIKNYIKLAGYEETDPFKLRDEIEDNKKNGDINSADLAYYNLCSWLSLRRKGFMMLEKYEEAILPMIEEVHSIQRKVELPNEKGDKLIGLIDFEATFVGKEGIYTVDNKTSSRKYKASDVNDKGQLVLYDEFTENGKGAYCVLLKKVKKNKIKRCDDCDVIETGRKINCPSCKEKFVNIIIENEIEFQVLGKEIEEESKDLLFDEINDILERIEIKEFPEDRSACFQFGKKCIYYDYCREGDTEGLVRG